jgi:short-subunit dehydrogenase
MSSANRGVALVTGASTGIGYATAVTLAKAGFQVFGTSRKPTSDGPADVTMLVCDVSDDASVSKLVSDIVAETGRIDLLVNNAGVGLVGGAEESSISQAQQLFNINFFGILRATNAVLPIMRRQKSGRIINMSSVLGLMPGPFLALYVASKHAVEGYSESLDHEVRVQGVRVILVEPAYTRTSFEENRTEADQTLEIYNQDRDRMGAVIRKAIETGDMPQVVAEAVLKAATARTPKHRYTAGQMAWQVSVLRRFVPEFLFDKSLRKQNGLPV